ncbi:MAG TPA: hypothetical protein VKD43_07560 [Xanthobacteraceae bacterium]|nr:hypothetical protein [Xanthobacteraceae bacterium]
MSGIVGQRVSLGQANGPDVELIVTGTELYASYETPDGYPAIYDDRAGLFCFAHIVDGEFQSTGVPVTSAPPPDAPRHAKESDAVRGRKIAERQMKMESRSRSTTQRNAAEPRKE